MLERSKLDQILKEKKLLQSSDGSSIAKELGKLDAADVLIFATITDFNGNYRVVLKLLDTKNGGALGSIRMSLVKTSSLEGLNKVSVKSAVVQQPTSNAPPTVVQEQPVANKYGDLSVKNSKNPNG